MGDLILPPELQLLPAVPTRQQIEALEDAIRAQPIEHQVAELPLKHTFHAGMYAREMTIPAGMLLTGKAHRSDHLNFLHCGEIVVWTEAGMRYLVGPVTIPSFAGIKRVGLALTDCVWSTVHITSLSTVEDVDRELVEPNRWDAPAITQEETPCPGTLPVL